MASPSALWDEAGKRATRYAPPPKYAPVEAGFAGAFATFIALMVFTAFAGLGDAFEMQMGWTTVAGFALPYLYFWWQLKRHQNAKYEEYRRLEKHLVKTQDDLMVRQA